MDKLRKVDGHYASILEERGFEIYAGWSDSLADQIVERSTESTIMQYTPKDHIERFSSHEAAHRWHDTSAKRYVYSLFHTAELAGLIWYSDKPLIHDSVDDAKWTFAIRLYDSSLGKRLARPFIRSSEQDFRHHEPSSSIWLETDEDNTAARHLYETVGYTEIETTDNRVLMTKEK